MTTKHYAPPQSQKNQLKYSQMCPRKKNNVEKEEPQRIPSAYT